MLLLFICNLSSLLYLHLTPPCTAAREIPKFTRQILDVKTYENAMWHNLNVSNNFITDPKFQRDSHVINKQTDHTWHLSEKYVLFPGKPRWTRGGTPMKLTYGFSKDCLIKYISLSDIKAVFRRAFAKWAKAIPVIFIESDDYLSADIKIGFYSGDHGDGQPFDGVLGVLAHSFSPESGKFHLDADETWAVDFEVEKSPNAIDLESVALHEIGHLLGLAHSLVKEAVMFPSLKPRNRKVDLTVDDVEGVQALYGSNRNFTFGDLLASDTLANQAVDLRIGSYQWTVLIFLCFCVLI